MGANRLDAPALQVLFNQRVLAVASASVGTLSWEAQAVAAGEGRAAPEYRRMLSSDALGPSVRESIADGESASTGCGTGTAEVEVSIVGDR